MNDNDAGQFHRRRSSAVGADRAHEISFDASVSLRRWDGLVRGRDTVIGLGHMLLKISGGIYVGLISSKRATAAVNPWVYTHRMLKKLPHSLEHTQAKACATWEEKC